MKDTAETLLQLLSNATGAEFEDQNMAVEIIEMTLIKSISETLKERRNAMILAINDCDEFDKPNARILTNQLIK